MHILRVILIEGNDNHVGKPLTVKLTFLSHLIKCFKYSGTLKDTEFATTI